MSRQTRYPVEVRQRAGGPLVRLTWLQPLPNIMASAPYPTPCDYVALKQSELPPETGWWHLAGCDCEFCRGGGT